MLPDGTGDHARRCKPNGEALGRVVTVRTMEEDHTQLRPTADTREGTCARNPRLAHIGARHVERSEAGHSDVQRKSREFQDKQKEKEFAEPIHVQRKSRGFFLQGRQTELVVVHTGTRLVFSKIL
jgi:hypothetical protein